MPEGKTRKARLGKRRRGTGTHGHPETPVLSDAEFLGMLQVTKSTSWAWNVGDSAGTGAKYIHCPGHSPVARSPTGTADRAA